MKRLIKNFLSLFVFLLVAISPFIVESDSVKIRLAPIYIDSQAIFATPGTQLKNNTFYCTAYSLDYASCEKTPNDPYYGITSSGVDLKNKTHREAMALAVDPDIIPMGSKVLIVFENSSYHVYNGVYTAVDVGGAIKGNRLDVFIPSNSEALRFGRKKADVYIL